MDRKTAENYLDICAAIKDLKEQLSIMNSRGGIMEASRQEEIISGLAALIHEKKLIDGYGETLPFRQRRIFEMRVKQRLKWSEIAARMGYRYTEDSVRKIYSRSFGSRRSSREAG